MYLCSKVDFRTVIYLSLMIFELYFPYGHMFFLSLISY